MMKYLKKVLLGVLLLVIRMQSSFPMGAGAGSSVRRQAAYACNFCDAVFSKMTEFVSHRLQKHAQSVGFACDFCGEKCMSPIALREHKKMHSDKPLFSCEICNKAFYKKK